MGPTMPTCGARNTMTPGAVEMLLPSRHRRFDILPFSRWLLGHASWGNLGEQHMTVVCRINEGLKPHPGEPIRGRPHVADDVAHQLASEEETLSFAQLIDFLGPDHYQVGVPNRALQLLLWHG